MVLLDLNLGGEDGGSLLPLVRSRHPTARVVLISGYFDAERWLEVGPRCDLVLPKPVQRSTLLRLVERLDEGSGDGLAELAKESALAESERRVLERARRHATVEEIADRLGIARSTVKTCLQRIFDKTGVRSVRGILARADVRSRRHPYSRTPWP